MEEISKAKRVFIYYRTATQRQNNTISLDMQEKVCRAFYTEHGLTIVDVFTEVASA